MGDENTNAGPIPHPSQSHDDARSRDVSLEFQVSLETISNLSFLAHECAEYPEKARAYLRALDEQVERLAGLMRKVLQRLGDQ